MTTFRTHLARIVTVALIALLAACQTVTPPPPTPDPTPDPTPTVPLVLYVDGFTTPQFVNYPTMTLHNVYNGTASPFVNRVILSRCLELGVYTYFTSAPTTIMPGQTTDVRLPYSGGYRMMVDAGAVCSGTVRSVAGQPDWRTVQNPNVSAASQANLGVLQAP